MRSFPPMFRLVACDNHAYTAAAGNTGACSGKSAIPGTGPGAGAGAGAVAIKGPYGTP